MKLEDYIKENWETLPKSKFDDLELVIVKEKNRDDGGWGHHSYEGIGVNKDGKYMWVYSSGCSCNGGPSSYDADIKSLFIANPELETIDPEKIDYESLVVTYDSY